MNKQLTSSWTLYPVKYLRSHPRSLTPCKLGVMWNISRSVAASVLVQEYWSGCRLEDTRSTNWNSLCQMYCWHLAKPQASNTVWHEKHTENARPVSVMAEPGNVCRLRSITLSQTNLTCYIKGKSCCEVHVNSSSDDSTEPATNWMWSDAIKKPLRWCYA